jgi:signal transduction histidine kinase
VPARLSELITEVQPLTFDDDSLPPLRDVVQGRLREALSFLGHNAREGHSSTLALLELQRIRPDPMAMAELSERVERNARKSLAAIDDFMDLSAARTAALRIEEIDLADLLVEVVADAWSLASRHGIRVLVAAGPETAPARADRELLAGALAKLLRDVAARTPRGVDVHCALGETDEDWVIEVKDLGAAVHLGARQGASPWDGSVPADERIAPGLALVQIVTERHAGWMRIESDGGQRQTLRIGLPRLAS